mmetsp:Transcript_9152/g.30980  ORF Transcript_9152/g.30980 Transcript_9152/m.30980 type:complete len:126 (+) Transcript_9152:103-480(+)
MVSNRHNHLSCTKLESKGHVMPNHQRTVGGPHLVCGTAGIDETKVEWYDGFQDDYETYQPIRNPAGYVVGANKSLAPSQGADLITRDEWKWMQNLQKGHGIPSATGPYKRLATHFDDLLKKIYEW